MGIQKEKIENLSFVLPEINLLEISSLRSLFRCGVFQTNPNPGLLRNPRIFYSLLLAQTSLAKG
jgi:hypothetical protein